MHIQATAVCVGAVFVVTMMRSGDCHFKLALCAAREAAGAIGLR
jgi:hypothetical protein